MGRVQADLAFFMADDCRDVNSLMTGVSLCDLQEWIEKAREKLRTQNERDCERIRKYNEKQLQSKTGNSSP